MKQLTDRKAMFLSELDRLISDYKGEKGLVTPVTHANRNDFYRISEAITALETLKPKIEKIKVDTSSDTYQSDFTEEVEQKIREAHQILRDHTNYPNGTYKDAKPGIIEAFSVIREYLPRLEEVDRRL